jgi:hypothetical protein
MKLQLEWTRPISLKDGSRQNLIYSVDKSKLPKIAGIYVFGRRYGSNFEALYVGKGGDIRGRIGQQLERVPLMKHLQKAKSGKRIVLSGRFNSRSGQQEAKYLKLIERALIRYFLSEGHDLVNKQGTRLRRHEITSKGKHPKKFIPSPMFLDKGKGE